MKNLLFSLSLLATSIIFMGMNGCKKGCKAGTGGDITLKLKPEHHGQEITGTAVYPDSAYIKFNSSEFPGPSPSSYDMVIAGNGGENFVMASGLKCGQYYIMMTGFDTSAIWNIRVVGGIPFNITETSGEQTLVVPVSE